jgi:hypothetical protein
MAVVMGRQESTLTMMTTVVKDGSKPITTRTCHCNGSSKNNVDNDDGG